MNSTLNKFIMFTAGAAIGSLVTWKLLKTKYEQIAREEIDSMREYFKKKTSDRIDEEPACEPDDDGNMSIEDYTDILRRAGYDVISNDEKTDNGDAPRVISPDEFGELPNYEVFTLFYYADKVVTDVNGNIVDDVDDIVGLDSLTHFGEYEEDSVFVRNDARGCDYEILRDERKYYDTVNKDPHHAEV